MVDNTPYARRRRSMEKGGLPRPAYLGLVPRDGHRTPVEDPELTPQPHILTPPHRQFHRAGAILYWLIDVGFTLAAFLWSRA